MSRSSRLVSSRLFVRTSLFSEPRFVFCFLFFVLFFLDTFERNLPLRFSVFRAWCLLFARLIKYFYRHGGTVSPPSFK